MSISFIHERKELKSRPHCSRFRVAAEDGKQLGNQPRQFWKAARQVAVRCNTDVNCEDQYAAVIRAYSRILSHTP